MRIVGYVFFIMGFPVLLWPFSVVPYAVRWLTGRQNTSRPDKESGDHETPASPKKALSVFLVIFPIFMALATFVYFVNQYMNRPKRQSKWEQLHHPEKFRALEFPGTSPVDVQERWLDCRRGNVQTCAGLGFSYMKAAQSEKDYDLIELYCTLACEEGENSACLSLYKLGKMYDQGTEVKQDPDHAKRLIRKACLHNVDEACKHQSSRE